MKECYFNDNPLYRKNRRRKLVEFFCYKGFFCYILSLGSHPTAYVISKNCKVGVYLSHEQLNNIVVHGGITYESDELFVNDEAPPIKADQIIGWDYAHGGDLTIFDESYLCLIGRIWTLQEIEEECKNVVDQIIAMEAN